VECLKSGNALEHQDPLHGISTELSVTYQWHIPRAIESVEITLDNVNQYSYSSPPPLVRKPNQKRLALLQEHLLIWRNKLWEDLRGREYILCEDMLPETMIAKLKSNASKIQSADDLRNVLALSPASGLTRFIPELLNCVLDSLRGSENMQHPPTPVRPRASGKPQPQRQPLRNITNNPPRAPRISKFTELK
jgi:hypothetical protein